MTTTISSSSSCCTTEPPQGDNFATLTAKSDQLNDCSGHTHTGCGQHWCALYHSKSELVQLTADFILEGIKENDMIGYYLDTFRQQEVIESLKLANVDIKPLVDKGQFKFYAPTDIYLVDGLFSAARAIQGLKDNTSNAIGLGYKKYRVTGEMSWALRCHMLPVLFQYEADLREFFHNYQCITMCQYDMNLFDPACLLSVLSSHPKAVIGVEKYDNFYYMPASEILVGDLPGSTLKYWINNLKMRKRMEMKLQQKNEELSALNAKLQREMEERKKMETAKDQAEALSKMKSDFLSVVSHEIRTPLNGIVCMANMLSENTQLTPEQKEFVGVIEVSSEHLMTVLNDILDFSKIEADKLQLDEKPFSLVSCVNGVVDMFRAREKKVTIRHYMEDGLPTLINGDVTRLRQILFNLMSNAIKFTPPEGIVEVALKRKSPPSNSPNDPVEIQFSVHDTGIGKFRFLKIDFVLTFLFSHST